MPNNRILQIVIARVLAGAAQTSEAPSKELACALQMKADLIQKVEVSSSDGRQTAADMEPTLTVTCDFLVLAIDFEEEDDDGYEYITCHDQALGRMHYLRDDQMTADIESGDQLKVVLAETHGASGDEAVGALQRGAGKRYSQHEPPWETEQVPLYRVVKVLNRVPTSVLEMERREKYGLTQHLTSEHKEMDILQVACDYDDYPVEYFEYPEEAWDALFARHADLSYGEALNLSSLGRMSAPPSKGKFLHVKMFKTLRSVVGADGKGCPAWDCMATAIKLIPEQHPGVDPGSYTFRIFFHPRTIGRCGWAGLAGVGCGHYSRLPNPGGCFCHARFAGAWVQQHELGHNQGIVHPRSVGLRESGDLEGNSGDMQSIMSHGPLSWNRAEMWQMGVLRDKLPDVFTWAARSPAMISLGSMALPFEETGAEAASARIPCPCCEPIVDPKSADYGQLDYWLQYRGTRGRFGFKKSNHSWYIGKLFVHSAHKYRGDGELHAALYPGETYNAPKSPIYVHFCAASTDAVAYVSLAFNQQQAKALCPGAPPAQLDIPERMVPREPQIGYPGLLCDFPFFYKGVVHHDCFARDGFDGSWCTSGREIQHSECNEDNHGNGANYRGCQSVTINGHTCQRWDSQTPHTHYKTPSGYPDAGLEDNYCRNPDGEARIWCYTTEPSKRWDYCAPLGPTYLTCSMDAAPTFEECSVIDGSSFSNVYPCQCGLAQCKLGRKCTASSSSCTDVCDETYLDNGEHYYGCQNRTRQGYACQRWDSQEFHEHDYGHVAKGGIASANYCRNPNDESDIWCFTTSPDKRWDFCDPLPFTSPPMTKPNDPGDPNSCWPPHDGMPSPPPISPSTTPSPLPTTVIATTGNPWPGPTTAPTNPSTTTGNPWPGPTTAPTNPSTTTSNPWPGPTTEPTNPSTTPSPLPTTVTASTGSLGTTAAPTSPGNTPSLTTTAAASTGNPWPTSPPTSPNTTPIHPPTTVAASTGNPWPTAPPTSPPATPSPPTTATASTGDPWGAWPPVPPPDDDWGHVPMPPFDPWAR